MRRKLALTKVSVKLRKKEFHEGWYLYLDIYPIYQPGSDKPQRIRENLHRDITTPVWDKSQPCKTDKDGTISYLPKRNQNGVIICRSAVDQESCIFADNVRALRQHEYDNASLYSETDAAQAELNEKGKQNFIQFVKDLSKKKHARSSESIIVNWNRVYDYLCLFAKSDYIPFSQLSQKLMEDFKMYLLTAPRGDKRKGLLSQNTANTYFAIFKCAVHQAFIDGYITVDIAAKVKGVPEEEVRREHLSLEELNQLAQTPCDNPILYRAALFSALTGLRLCDITKLKWAELAKEGEHHRINFDQKKTGGVEYMPISPQAYKLCGEQREPQQLVFEGIPDKSVISRPIKKWIKAAGITKHITFHCFRHTYATIQLTEGTDLFTLSKMMGHTNVRTTQVYAKVVDKKKEAAADAFTIDFGNNTQQEEPDNDISGNSSK